MTSATIKGNASAPVTQPETVNGEGQSSKDETEVTEAVPAAMATISNARKGELTGTMDFTLQTDQPSPNVRGTSLGSNSSSDQGVQSASVASSNIISTLRYRWNSSEYTVVSIADKIGHRIFCKH